MQTDRKNYKEQIQMSLYIYVIEQFTEMNLNSDVLVLNTFHVKNHLL